MINLKNYIKLGHFKDDMSLWEKVSTLDEAEKYAYRVILGERENILFEYSYLKNHFYDVLQGIINIVVINCDSKPDRILKEIEDSNGLVIFDNIGKLSDKDILKRVKDKILVC